MQVSSRWLILFFFCCSSALISFNISALTAVVPAISRDLNITANDAASVIPFYMIPYGLCALFYAPLTQRFSIKSLMIVSTAIYALTSWMCLWSDNLNIILTGRVLMGLAAAAVTPLALMTLGKIFEKEIRGRVIGLFFSLSFIGAMLGLILSGLMNWKWLFIIPAIFGGILSVAYYYCPNQGMEANSNIKVDYIKTFNMGGLRRILLFIFAASMLFHGVVKWYGVYLDQEYGFNQLTISSIIIVTAIAASIGQIVGGFITDKCGRANSCYIGFLILGLSTAALLGHYNIVIVTVLLSFIGVGWTIAHNGISTVLTDLPDEYRAELASLNSSVRFFSGGIGFYLSGSFFQADFSKTFFIIGLLMLLMMLVIHKIVPKKVYR